MVSHKTIHHEKEIGLRSIITYVDKGIINSSLQVRTILIYRIYNNPNFTIWFGSGMTELAPFFPGNKHAHVYTTEAIKRYSRIEESN